LKILDPEELNTKAALGYEECHFFSFNAAENKEKFKK